MRKYKSKRKKDEDVLKNGKYIKIVDYSISKLALYVLEERKIFFTDNLEDSSPWKQMKPGDLPDKHTVPYTSR